MFEHIGYAVRQQLQYGYIYKIDRKYFCHTKWKRQREISDWKLHSELNSNRHPNNRELSRQGKPEKFTS